MALKKLTRHDNGIVFADTADPNYQVRFKFNQGRKNIDGARVDNNICEIIISDLYGATLNERTLVDALSIRIRVSGSSISHERLKAIVNAVATDLPKWAKEDVLIGFEPLTTPTMPV